MILAADERGFRGFYLLIFLAPSRLCGKLNLLFRKDAKLQRFKEKLS
jgi:hypothetical protein